MGVSCSMFRGPVAVFARYVRKDGTIDDPAALMVMQVPADRDSRDWVAELLGPCSG